MPLIPTNQITVPESFRFNTQFNVHARSSVHVAISHHKLVFFHTALQLTTQAQWHRDSHVLKNYDPARYASGRGLQEGTSTYRCVADCLEIHGGFVSGVYERSTSLKEGGSTYQTQQYIFCEGKHTSIYRTRGHTAWCETLPYASVTKADVPPLSTPGLRLRAGHTAHDHYDHDVQSRRWSSAYLFLFLDLPGYGQAGKFGLCLSLRRIETETPRREENSKRKDVECGVGDPDGAVHSGGNEGHEPAAAKHNGERTINPTYRLPRASKKRGASQGYSAAWRSHTHRLDLKEDARATRKSLCRRDRGRVADSEDTHRTGGRGTTVQTERTAPELD
ncbi:hypothetical protein B0H16DRAFT_1704384 [Mycena metata]|uniref:Uncharacterized protein n=1 Tax=Mycena metata TaxID=1033252 RepID=A0AAD7GW54_9AGAR|nr:hypothetical protein B0H16DRAFT_1704384 [Mycena metata]